MRSTFHSLEIAKRSLFTQQAALSTTGHNIANANTQGYSRQVVNMTAARPIEAPGMMRSNAPGQLGMGVEFTSITRVREKFLDDQFRNENKTMGNWTIQKNTLEKLETIISEPSETGIRTVLDNFWKSWSDLSKDPENITGRKVVRENAKALTDAFNQASKQLAALKDDLTENIDVKARHANTLVTQISNLNKEIQRIEGLGDDANDLRDQRDQLTDELSGIANIKVVEQADGYSITMGTTILVSGGTPTSINSAIWEDAYSSGQLTDGEVYGMIHSRDKLVADYQSQMDTLANSLATGETEITLPEGSVLPDNTTLLVVAADGTRSAATFSGAARTIPAGGIKVVVNGINGLHQLGYNFNDPVETGKPFFESKFGGVITAGNIQLNASIDADPSLIATSMRTAVNSLGKELTVKGNNQLALSISQLNAASFQYKNGASNALIQKGTISDFFRSVVGQLGVQSSEAGRQQTNQKALVDQIDARRMSVSGVSLDEETANMIKFQHAYNASARVMTTMDEILDKVINSMGIVGR